MSMALSERLDRCIAQLEVSASWLESGMQRIDHAEAQVKELESERTYLLTEITTLQTTICDRTARMGRLEARIELKEELLRAAEDQRAELEGRIAEMLTDEA